MKEAEVKVRLKELSEELEQMIENDSEGIQAKSVELLQMILELPDTKQYRGERRYAELLLIMNSPNPIIQRN